MDKDDVWNVIKRYDGYYSGANNKASILIALNALAITGIVLKWQELLERFKGHPAMLKLAACLLIVAAAGTLAALFWAIASAIPYVNSPQESQSYRSLVFFGHVAEFPHYDKCLDAVRERKNNDDEVMRDLCFQAFALAQGLREKHRQIAHAFRAFLYAAMMPFGLLLLLTVIQMVL
jgi:hypothetical protein